jgi:hypothetical protein
VSINSCQKDENYNPKRKISKIYRENLSLTEGKLLYQEWTWDNDLLKKIDNWGVFFDDGEAGYGVYSTDLFSYQDKKLVKIDHGNGYYSEIIYDGSKYKKFETFDNSNDIWMRADFTYNNKKVSNINLILTKFGFEIDKTVQAKILSSFIPKELMKNIAKSIEEVKKSKGNNDMTLDMSFTYNEDNIKEIIVKQYIMEMNISTSTITYVSHDKKQNPFYKKLEFAMVYEFGLGMIMVTSKNNPLETKTESRVAFTETEIFTTKLSYIYENDFPIEVVETSNNLGFEYTIKKYYEYK